MPARRDGARYGGWPRGILLLLVLMVQQSVATITQTALSGWPASARARQQLRREHCQCGYWPERGRRQGHGCGQRRAGEGLGGQTLQHEAHDQQHLGSCVSSAARTVTAVATAPLRPAVPIATGWGHAACSPHGAETAGRRRPWTLS